MPAAMKELQWDIVDPSNGKGGEQDGVLIEQRNGRQGIRNKEHQATQKQVERIQ
jgi:hypothetical protein